MEKKIELNAYGLAESAGIIHVYHSSPETGEYIRESDEFLIPGVGIPAHSHIEIPLPKKNGYAVCFGQNGWEYIEDHRKAEAYSTETRELIKITMPGLLPIGVTKFKPETPFDVWNGEKWVTDSLAQRQANIEDADIKKAQLLALADMEIERLKDAIELSIETDQEADGYAKWRIYRVLLNRIDTLKAPDIVWPEQPF